MRRTLLLLCRGLAAASLSSAAPVGACEPIAGYRVPTNFEMVEQADVILLGVVERGPALRRPGAEGPLVIRPTVLLKGRSLPAALEMDGVIGHPPHASLSDPNELERAHPNAFAGACSRYVFVRGATILIFLRRENGVLRRYSPAFSRSAEDVPGPNARWVRAVRLYVEVAALPPARRRAALAARRDALLRRAGDADAWAIAADIDRHLAATGR